jgi:serine/threonine-protein phosphatase 4 regulatory subunit 1
MMYNEFGGQEDENFEEDDFIGEYAIDDTLDPITRLERYHTSDFSLQRLVLVRELCDTAKSAGFDDTMTRLLPLLATFVADSEPAVRQMLVEQLHPLSIFLIDKGGERGYNELINTFLPYTFELLVDKNVEVGASAVNTLIKLVDLVKPEHVEAQLLNVVVTLARDERAEDYRMVAAQLFNELAPRFGPQMCRDVVVKEVKTLTDDVSFSVRKMVASNLSKISTVIGKQETVTFLFPCYLQLSKDEIWGVRKACAESLCNMSECVPKEFRHNLFEIFERFTEDVSRWVRVAAYQQLGQLISTCEPGTTSPNLIKSFTDMAFQSESGFDSDFAEYCAYSFPAVIQAVGKEHWSELEPAYLVLIKDVQWKVRKSLAHSLHEIANIVGQETTEKTLTQAFDLFIKDLDEVKVGVVNNVSEFLQHLGMVMREKYVPIICAMPSETDNWRLRKMIAQKLGALASLVSPSTCKKNIAELGIHLLEDSVADVRQSSFKSCATILRRLFEGEPADREAFLGYLKNLKASQNYQVRQMFVYIAHELLEMDIADGKTKIFESDFLEGLAALAEDRVPNVRLTVARVLTASLLNAPTFKSNPVVVEMKNKLSQDKVRDVAYFASLTIPRK